MLLDDILTEKTQPTSLEFLDADEGDVIEFLYSSTRGNDQFIKGVIVGFDELANKWDVRSLDTNRVYSIAPQHIARWPTN